MLIKMLDKLLRKYKYSIIRNTLRITVELNRRGIIDLNNKELGNMMCQYYAKQYSRD